MAIDRWVNANTKAMLMILCKSTWTNNVAPICSLARVDVDNRYDTSSSSFDDNATSLIELEGEDVLVVCKSDDELDDELSSTSNDRTASAPVRMLPVDSIVLLMDTNDVGCLSAFAIWLDDHTTQVFDYAKTVATQLKVVGAVTETAITEVESLLSVEWWSWVSIRNSLRLTVSFDCANGG